MRDEDITRALGLRPMDEVAEEAEVVEVLPAVKAQEGDLERRVTPAEPDQEHLADIEFARQNIKSVIEGGSAALRDAIALARTSDSPRAVEVVADLIRTMATVNQQFIDVSEKKKFERTEQPSARGENTVTNNILAISTTELLGMLKGK